MSRQEDFHEQAEKYANECGGTTQEKCVTMTDYFAGCEHGYQYAVEKACEWLQIRMASENTIEQFKQFMED